MKAVVASFLTLLGTSHLAAQAGTVTGTVATADGTPVASARISVLGTTLTTLADTKGDFRLVGVPAWNQTIDVRMLGYTPSQVRVVIAADTIFNVRVVLAPIPLDAIDVDAPSGVMPALRGFEERMARGIGTFFTREDILRIQARLFTDILGRVPGIHIRKVSGAYGESYAVMQRGRHCPMAYYVNGTPFAVPSDIPVNHFISPEDVIAVEVYSASENPPQFNASSNRAACGVVVVWTRVGVERRRRDN
jgi:hypothetical protein